MPNKWINTITKQLKKKELHRQCPHCLYSINITSLYPDALYFCTQCKSDCTLSVIDNRSSKDKWLEVVHYITLITIFTVIYFILGVPSEFFIAVFVYAILTLTFKQRFFSNIECFDYNLNLVDGLSYQQKKLNEKNDLLILLTDMSHDLIGNTRLLLKNEWLQDYWSSCIRARDQHALLKTFTQEAQMLPSKSQAHNWRTEYLENDMRLAKNIMTKYEVNILAI
jgi:hypothetical protein